MFFPEKIKSINKYDQVLEIGPGNTPFYRSDVLLELRFEDEEEAYLQSGATEKKDLKKQIVYYNGGRFPFKDNEFDYVICSHVLEHIPLPDLEVFISELIRVAGKGYIEVPLYSFELLTNLDYHMSFININNDNKINFLFKEDIDMNDEMYNQLGLLLKNSTVTSNIIQSNLETVCYGFEFNKEIRYEIIKESHSFFSLIQNPSNINLSKGTKFYFRRVLGFFNKNIFLQKLYNRFRIVI